MKFILDGCDISFTAEAPEDITLAQLLKQCDKIKPMWCACGVRSLRPEDYQTVEIEIGYDYIRKTGENVECWIIDPSISEDDEEQT